jgi:hypothetical protein
MPLPGSPGTERGGRYLSLSGDAAKLKKYLGVGTDGEVGKTRVDPAVKVLKYEFDLALGPCSGIV